MPNDPGEKKVGVAAGDIVLSLALSLIASKMNPQMQCQFEAEYWGALKQLWEPSNMEKSEIRTGQERKKSTLILTLRFLTVKRVPE